MDLRSYTTEGIILARNNYGEADRILTVFTKKHGKIRVIAKGIRKISSRKKGYLELFNFVKLFIVLGKNIDIVTEVESKDTFLNWRKDLTKVAVCFHLCEIVNRLSAERQENPELFQLIYKSLKILERLEYWDMHNFVQNFKISVLEDLGFLEIGKSAPKNLDIYIESLINSSLRTKKFLNRI